MYHSLKKVETRSSISWRVHVFTIITVYSNGRTVLVISPATVVDDDDHFLSLRCSSYHTGICLGDGTREG